MANIRSFPNNQDEYIGAEEVMRWLHGRSSGVFGADENAAVFPVLDTMAVTVSDGNGWLSNAKGDGIVWWVDNEEKEGQKLELSVDLSDAYLPRIDRVVVSWKTANYVALPEVVILKGTPASNPVPPALTNDSTVRQISLAKIHIPAGVTAITSVMITDERLNPEVCGIVTEKVTADTSMVNAQYLDAVAQLRKAIQQAWDGEIPDGSITQEMLDPNIKMGSNDVYVGTEEPTGEDRPKLWIDPDGSPDTKESADHPGCYYRTVNGTTEWVNPPMVSSAEYRTTERFAGKPVYVCIRDSGYLPNTGTKTLAHNIPNVSAVLSIHGIATDGRTIPYKNGNESIEVAADNANIYITTTTNMTAQNGTFCIKYVKTMD